MIIGESTPESPLKPKGPPLNGQGEGQVPPPYAQYQSTSSYPTPPPIVVEYRQSPTQRFLAAFGVAVIIYFLFAMLTTSLVSVTGWSRRGHNDRVSQATDSYTRIFEFK